MISLRLPTRNGEIAVPLLQLGVVNKRRGDLIERNVVEVLSLGFDGIAFIKHLTLISGPEVLIPQHQVEEYSGTPIWKPKRRKGVKR